MRKAATALLLVVCISQLLPLALAALPQRNIGAQQSANSKFFDEMPEDPPDLTCEMCKFIVESFHYLIRSNASIDEIESLATGWCVLYKVQAEAVCSGLAKVYGKEFVDVMDTRFVSPQEICDHFWACNVTDRRQRLNERHAEGYPARIESSSQALHSDYAALRQHRYKSQVASAANVGYFLQITDIHWDPLYQAGTNTDCGEPQCCRAQFGPGDAGRWGDYHCDTPLALIQNTLQTISSMFPKLDFVLWNGDNPPDDIWEQSREMNLANDKSVTNWVAKAFPNTPVYPTLGNHDSFPCDQFAAPPKNEWLMYPIASYWSVWLPDTEVQSTIKTGGYYSTLIRPGLRVMSINTQYCDIFNFWLVLGIPDIAGQLEWMKNTLARAEKNNETVWIIGHIPPGNANCLQDYSAAIADMVYKYSHVIKAQFYGHTHHDEFQLWLKDNKTAVNMAYVAPSVTPQTNINPSFRIYTYDRNSLEILNYDQYHLNLSAANAQQGSPQWTHYYNAKTVYGLPDLSARSWYGLVDRFRTNDKLFQEWNQRQATGTPTSACTGECKRDTICSLLGGTVKEVLECTGQQLNLNNLWQWIINHIN